MEIKKLAEMIAKRVYPETEKEKNCINEFGKMIIKRGQLRKRIIELINDSKRKEDLLDSGTEQSDSVHIEIPY
jgi:hypothetical protein